MNRLLLFVSCCFVITYTYAQENLQVLRGSAVSRDLPILNIHVDEENSKWVSNREGVYRLYGADLAVPVELAPGEQSLLFFPKGNGDIRWTADKLRGVIGDILNRTNFINAATYDARRKELWLGTTQSGVFRLATEPELRLIERFDTRNSKLKSDFINTIFIDPGGRHWIGTRDGVLYGDNGRWKLLERYFDVRAIAANGAQIWLMGEEMVGKMEKEVWYPIEIPPRKTEGDLRDIAFDFDGNLWIASEVITRYNPETESFTVFGPAQEYTSQFATGLTVDQDGAVWVGTRDKGLYVIQKGGAFAAACVVEKELSCTGNGRDAALQVKVTGGQPPFRYAWSGNLEGDNPRNLAPGVYTVTVTDSKGLSTVSKAEIADPRMTADAGQTQPESTPGAADGRAAVNPQGGKPGYTYRWDNGETTREATRLSTGSHTVTVTDQAGCSTTATVEVGQRPADLNVEVTLTHFVDCNGGNQGALKVVASGGTAPYRYQWNNGALRGDQVTGLTAGVYQVTVTDAGGASRSVDFEITEPAVLTASATATSPASTGNADGQARVQATGGTAGYSYAWDTGETAAEAKALAPGAHTVTITDAAGCTTTATVNITEDILPLAVQLRQTATITCNGGTGAALTATVSGGKGPFRYQWSEAALSGQDVSGLRAGAYQLTVTDAAGTSQTAQITIGQPEALTATAAATSPASTGNADGQARVQASGGTAGYSYQWDNGETAAEAKALAPGAHTVTITDAAGCTTTATVNITEDILPLAVQLRQTAAITCNGGTGAALTATVSGGKGPFRYQWSEANLNGQDVSGLRAGAYLLTVTDAAGTSQTAQITIAQPEALTATATATSPASTGNADGQARVQATGGTAGYTYAWDTGETAAEARALAPGAHTVTITDAAGCTTTATVTITEDILPLAVQLRQTAAITCNGGTGAALTATVSGGKGPFRYQWSEANLNGQEVSGLRAGAYQLTVTDAAGTSQTAQITIAQPEALTATATATSPASTGNADGQARVQATGGTAGYSYQWDNGETAAEAKALAPGAHTVTITDAAGCTTTATVTITEDILPLAVQLRQTAVIICNGGTGAALTATVSGGKGPFRYQWSEANLNGQDVSGLRAGAYQLTVTDAAGTSQTAQITIAQPEALTATATATSPASTGNADGQARVQATGGTAGYTYAWDSGETAAEAKALAPGAHTVTITDAAGCTTTATVTITEDILPLAVQLQQTAAITCNGGTGAALTATVSGGKGPFRYQWSEANLNGQDVSGLRAGAYQLTVTDAAGTSQTAQITIGQPEALSATATATSPASTGNADGQARVQASGGTAGYTYAWDTGETAAEAKALAPGAHTVTITDAAGCTTTATVTITEDILPLAVQLQQTAAITCNGGTGAALSATVSGGKGPFRYQWSEANLNGQDVSGLRAGAYQLTVTDAVGTSQTAQITIAQPDALSATATATSPASTGNADGQARVQASGGTAGYSYQWDNGETAAEAKALAPGAHTVTITDAAGCTTTATVTITEDILPLAVQLQQTAAITCNGGTGAALTATVSGGKGPFRYQWSEANLNGQEVSGLRAGAYQLTVTDAAGTSQTAQITIAQPEALSATATATSPASTGNADGQARVQASGGTAGYTYAWDTGETAAEAKALAPGAHTVTITDAAGCTATATVSITENILPLAVQLQQTAAIKCNGGTGAALTAMVSGGKGPFRYQWSEAALSGNQVSDLKAGEYQVTVTDESGQTQSAAITIADPPALAVSLLSKKPVSDAGRQDGKASIQASGGTGSFTYAWDNGETTAEAVKLTVATHAVTVTDANGCQIVGRVEIVERAIPGLTASQLRSGQTVQMQKLQFEADSTRLTGEARPILDELYEFLNENPTIVVEIGGHTNSLPPPEYCDQLSTARAKAVADYLVEKGIDGSRVYYRGYGKRQPLFSNQTEDGRRRNQRVEIKILRM